MIFFFCVTEAALLQPAHTAMPLLQTAFQQEPHHKPRVCVCVCEASI